MATNTIDSNLQLTELLDSALVAFKKAVLPLRSFSAVFSNVELQGDNTMTLPYYPLATSASQARAEGGSYLALATDTATESRQVTIDRNKVQGISFTSTEVARQPKFDPAQHGKLKGHKLAIDIIQDIFSIVTAANFPADTIAAVDAATFDQDDVAELAQLCVEDNWPGSPRGLILNPALYYALVKQPALIDQSQSGDGSVLRQGRIPDIMGFDVFMSNGVHDNGENLAGLAVGPSAILTGFAPVPPTSGVRLDLVDYQIVSDPDTGIVLEYKRIADGDTDKEGQFIEAHYGFAKGEEAAIKRIVTA